MKRKEPTQTERLMRALLAGRKVDRPYALNVLRIANPGARVQDIREAWLRERDDMTVLSYGDVLETLGTFKTVRVKGHSYYTIPPAYRAEVRKWWKERAK